MADEFKVHRLNAAGLAKAEVIASSFDGLLATICDVIPAGRERSLVITKLQEASFWAKRGLAQDPNMQEP